MSKRHVLLSKHARKDLVWHSVYHIHVKPAISEIELDTPPLDSPTLKKLSIFEIKLSISKIKTSALHVIKE